MTNTDVRDNDVVALRALIDDWAEAMRAKDADRAMAHCAADVVTFDLAPPLVSSSEREGPGGVVRHLAGPARL